MSELGVGHILELVLTVLVLLLGWLSQELYRQVKAVKKEVEDMKLDIAKNYVSYVMFQEFRKELVSIMNRVEDKIDQRLNSINH